MKLSVLTIAAAAVSAHPYAHHSQLLATSKGDALALWERPWSALRIVWKSLETSIAYVQGFWDTMFEKNSVTEYQTVYQWLKGHDKFTKLVKLIEYDKVILDVIDNPGLSITFFAPDDDAFPSIGPWEPREDFNPLDRDDKHKKKFFFGELLHEVLLYHVLPYNMESVELYANSTVATALQAKDGSFNSQSRRIKIDHTTIPYSLVINRYSRVIQSDIQVRTGRINIINSPLVPPLSILDGIHRLPQKLSTFTSAVQKVNFGKSLQYHYVPGKKSEKGHFEGKPSITAFVPTNDAFAALPRNLLLYLFSPLGSRALTKILAYHTIPDVILYTEWIHNVTREKNQYFDKADNGFEFSFNFTTALKNATVDVSIKKSTPWFPDPRSMSIDFEVQGHKIKQYDFAARNGVFHVIDQVLDPRGKHHEGSNGWDHWEDWLPHWAREA